MRQVSFSSESLLLFQEAKATHSYIPSPYGTAHSFAYGHVHVHHRGTGACQKRTHSARSDFMSPTSFAGRCTTLRTRRKTWDRTVRACSSELSSPLMCVGKYRAKVSMRLLLLVPVAQLRTRHYTVNGTLALRVLLSLPLLTSWYLMGLPACIRWHFSYFSGCQVRGGGSNALRRVWTSRARVIVRRV